MILANLLYILQGENYDTRRFLRYAYTNLRWWSVQQRSTLVYTAKIKALYTLSVLLLICLLWTAYRVSGWWGVMVVIPIGIIFLPITVVAANAIFFPLDYILKKRKIELAKKIVQSSKATVIGITGSYGKTSTKEIIAAILSKQASVLKTSGNINTDIGVAQFIITNAHAVQSVDYFIVEMGAYHPGNIKAICDLVHPAYAVMTGISSAHLDRFGSMEAIIKTKFELAISATAGVYINADDETLKNRYTDFQLVKPALVSQHDASNIQFVPNYGGFTFEYDSERFACKLLAGHSLSSIMIAIHLLRDLDLYDSVKVREGIASIEFVPHRLELLYNKEKSIYVIDDSYNGTYAGFLSGLEVLQRAPGRTVVLTPGLVELGKESQRVHESLAPLYAAKVDLMLLIDTSATRFIKHKLDELGFTNVRVYPSAAAAHADLGNVLKTGDTILFQNDWSDIHL